MNYQDAIRKINKLLGLYKFNSYKIMENGEELITEGDLAIDEPIYIITPNGQLPARDGEYELEDTTKIKIKDGLVQEIKYNMEKKENMTDAMLKDGTVIKSPTFDVGEDVSIIAADGKSQPAPDGEHEIVLKDESGNENVIKIMVKDGKITERENVEKADDEMSKKEKMEDMSPNMTPDLSQGNDITDEEFKKTVMGILGDIKDAIGGIVKEQEDMKSKMAKFSKEPAGEPVKQAKNLTSEFNYGKNEAFAQLVKIRANAQNK
jgi:hypothetical protein